MEEQKTPFHEEDLRRLRKDKIKTELHFLNKNPLGLTQLTESDTVYNYELILRNLNNLTTELTGDLTPEEEQECDKCRDLLTEFLAISPVHSLRPTAVGFSIKNKTFFSMRNWLKFSKLLHTYQKLVFKLSDKYSGDPKTTNVEQRQT